MIDFYEQLCAKYPIISIEDGLAEDDWDGWVRMTERIGHQVQIVGDDLYGQPSDRLYLHAAALEFVHPVTGEKIRIVKEADF